MLSYSSTIQTDLKVYNSVFITDHPLYASTIIIGDANVIPVAYPDAYNVDQNGVLTVTVENGVLSNDIDTDNLITAELVSDVSNGTLVLNADGSFTYTPNELYYGQDSFTYRVFDRKDYSNIETVIITVNQVFTWNELIANTHEERVVADGGTVSDKLQLNIDLDSIGEANYNNLTFLMNPNGGSKSGKIYAIKPDNGTADLTVDRNSEASYGAEDGAIQFANANESRFNPDGSLLVEPQRTNLYLSSEDFITEARWKKYSNILILGVPSILGTDSYKFIPNSAIENHYLDYQPYSAKADTTYTFSIFAKKAELEFIQIATSSGFSGKYANFNLSTGEFAKGDLANYNIKTFSDGWYRISITETTVTSANRFLIIPLINGTEGRNPSYAGDDVSGLYITGAQLEEGSEATSYIFTNGATKTRLKDTITVVPPAGTTQIIETIDGVEQPPITTIPASYEVSEGNINQIKML